MHPATLSIQVFGVYLVLNGLSTAVMPGLMAANMGLPAGSEVALTPLGIVLTIFGGFLLAAARDQNVAFFGYTIWGRAFAVTMLLIFIGIGRLPMMFMMVVAIDGLSALWTWSRMRAPAPRAAAI